jgi:hypothetical protein
MNIRNHTLTIDTTGSAGSATGSGVTEAISGFLLDVHLDFHASAPATTDTTVKQTGAADNILVVTDSKTDARYAPRQPIVDAAASAITNGSDRYPINGTITVSLAGCNALTGAVVATIRTLE